MAMMEVSNKVSNSPIQFLSFFLTYLRLVINNAKKEFQNIAPSIPFLHLHHTPGGTHSLTHSLTTCLLTHSLTHSFIQGTSKEARNNHNAYYKLSAHFKWALNQVFRQKITDNLGLIYSFIHLLTHSLTYLLAVNRVIILEEDLEIAPDFFEYFAATSPLLDSDPTLLTVYALTHSFAYLLTYLITYSFTYSLS